MGSPTVWLVVAVICVSFFALTEAEDKIKVLEEHLIDIKKHLKHTPAVYTEHERTVISMKWKNILLGMMEMKFIPRKNIFHFMQVNLIMLQIIDAKTLDFYNNEKLRDLLVGFGIAYRDSKKSIDATRIIKQEYETTLEKQIEEIETEAKAAVEQRQTQKKENNVPSTKVSKLYNRFFHEVFTFYIDRVGPSVMTYLLAMDKDVRYANLLDPHALMIRKGHLFDAHLGALVADLPMDAHQESSSFITNLINQNHALFDVYVYAVNVMDDEEPPSIEDKAYMLKRWTEALETSLFYRKYTPHFTLDTDNRVRFHAIRHIFKHLEFLHSDKHVQQLYASSTELFKSFEEGYEHDVEMLNRIAHFADSNPQDGHSWIKFCDILSIPNIQDHISSQFLFKLLKTDLGFVENHNIVSKAVREQRIKQLPYIRHAINSMFLYTHGKNHLHMRAGMQKAVRAFDEYIQNHLKTLTAEKKWAYVELILMHYAPYFTEMMESFRTIGTILELYDSVKPSHLGEFKQTIEELRVEMKMLNDLVELSRLEKLFTESGKPATVDLQHPDLHAEHFKHAHEHHKDPVAKMLATKPEDDLDPETHRMYDKIMADMPPPPRVLSPDTTVPWCIQLVATYRHILDAHHNGLSISREAGFELQTFEKKIFHYHACHFGSNDMEIIKGFKHHLN